MSFAEIGQFIFTTPFALIESFLGTTLFLTIKFFLAIYVIVMFLDLVLLLLLRDLKGNFQEGFLGDKIPIAVKGSLAKKWEKIKKLLDTNDQSRYKLAVSEGYSMVDKVLHDMNIKGADMKEKLAGVKPGQLEYVDELKRAHEVREKILHDPAYELAEEEAREVMDIFEKFLKSMQFV